MTNSKTDPSSSTVSFMLQSVLHESFGSDIELFSREVFLDFKYLEFRTISGRVLGPQQGDGVPPGGHLARVLRKELNSTLRERIFSSIYDLGNPRVLDSKETRQKAIEEQFNRLKKEKTKTEKLDLSKADDSSSPADAIKALKKLILELTGNSYSDYTRACANSPDANINKSYAVKVLIELYRYRLFSVKAFNQFKKPTSQHANLEIRDCYAMPGYEGHPQKNVAFFADLKSSITHGMENDELSKLSEAMHKISDRYAASVFPSSKELRSYDVEFIEGNSPAISAIQSALPLGHRTLPERLDRSIYVSLILREIEHRNAGRKFINESLINKDSKVPLMENWTTGKVNAILKSFYDNDLHACRIAICSLLEHTYTDDEINKAYELSECLIWLVKSPLDCDPIYNYLESAAALITCLGNDLKTIKLKAYWYGKETTSNSPVWYLSSIHRFEDKKTMPEFYREYWLRRYDLTLSRLLNREDVWHRINQVDDYECARLIKLFQTTEFDRAIKLFNTYLRDEQNHFEMTGATSHLEQ